jgi:hypothetical protein
MTATFEYVEDGIKNIAQGVGLSESSFPALEAAG